jgi:acetolactate synthase-1/2/3 large subunit
MDAGAFGCLGVGMPFAVAASLAYPGRQVVCVTGDGAFGINAMEIDTAVRHGAKIVVIVSNNAAWNIERLDQETNHGGRVVGTLLAHSYYAAMARAFGAPRAASRSRRAFRPHRAGARQCSCSDRCGDVADGRVLGRN